MGEAKHRKRNDHSYGKIPKDYSYRGLVVSAPLEVNGGSIHFKSSLLDPQELRFSLLYWDKLAWPVSNAIYMGSGPDEQFLESARVLFRPNYTYSGNVAQGIALGQIQAFHDLENHEPGVWALAQGESSFLLKQGITVDGNGAYVELHRAIPIPKHDIPLAEILEFKQRRQDEITYFRLKLESFVTEIKKSSDRPSALKERVAEIDKACADLITVGKEWQFPIHFSSMEASFNLSMNKVFIPASTAWFTNEKFGLAAATAAAAVTGALCTIEIKKGFGLRSMKLPKNPYRYVYKIHQELK
jgi:Family of unknown function (DUF6236)